MVPSAPNTASASRAENDFRGSMAGLYAPLPTLRSHPRGGLRTDRGRRGLLLLHRSGLSPHTPCRSPGALRGRHGHCWPPPAQIRTCPIKASGSYLGCLTSKRMAAFRTRPSAWVTRSRPCVRSVLCCSAFPLVPGLGSTGSATSRPALFVGFIATMPESDFSGSCISGYGSSPSRHGPSAQKAYGRPKDLPVPAQGASVHARV